MLSLLSLSCRCYHYTIFIIIKLPLSCGVGFLGPGGPGGGGSEGPGGPGGGGSEGSRSGGVDPKGGGGA